MFATQQVQHDKAEMHYLKTLHISNIISFSGRDNTFFIRQLNYNITTIRNSCVMYLFSSKSI